MNNFPSTSSRTERGISKSSNCAHNQEILRAKTLALDEVCSISFMEKQSLSTIWGVTLMLICVFFTHTIFAVAVRDPTKPPVAKLSIINNQIRLSSHEASLKKINLEDYKIQGIIISSSRRLVLICFKCSKENMNNQLVRVGGTIGEARVVEINRNKVTLVIQGYTVIIDFIDTTHWNSWL